ncbi:MAG: aminomethyl-transferring glycine dehydrogenase subunit GcvPA [Deltaproteobacteria bacterium]|nr:aminomethyl-transferring glycine dehydrogenase subunit GcvPA [Deltaproteobacteria bacterium]
MRFHPHTNEDISAMLQALGVKDVQGLFASIPSELLAKRPLDMPRAASEEELLEELGALAARPPLTSFLGAGIYTHYMPSVVDTLVRRSEFITSYTPYQPEIAQGTLQAIFEYQTMVSELFGLPVANASMYDGASALAEGVMMALRLKADRSVSGSAGGRRRLLFARSLHPDYRETCATFLQLQDVTVEALPAGTDGLVSIDALKSHLGTDVAAVVVQTPNFFGGVEDLKVIAEHAHAVGALLVVAVTETLALGLLEAPGNLGADVVVGEGVGMTGGPQYGGPAVGLFATREEFLRQLPGRLVGEAKDKDGQKGYVLTLSTREQHIRREKATSNICTNQGLIALAYSIHLALRGPVGLAELAEHNLSIAHALEKKLAAKGVKRAFSAPYFNEFAVTVPNARSKHAAALKNGIVAGMLLERKYPEHKDVVLLSVNEQHKPSELDKLVEALS